jgi:hypothetical protein
MKRIILFVLIALSVGVTLYLNRQQEPVPVPAYQDYVARSQASEGLTITDGLKARRLG